MPMPAMKQERDLSPADFVRHPVWIAVHNYDSNEPCYEQSDEETFRPWMGPDPFAEKSGFVLVSATLSWPMAASIPDITDPFVTTGTRLLGVHRHGSRPVAGGIRSRHVRVGLSTPSYRQRSGGLSLIKEGNRQ
jgi:hypothetical protein